MGQVIRQLRLTAFVFLVGFAMRLLPDDATETYLWLTKMPKEY